MKNLYLNELRSNTDLVKPLEIIILRTPQCLLRGLQAS